MVTVSDLRRIVGGRDIRGDLKPLLKIVGTLIVSDAQGAFKAQKFQGEAWPGRYENQSPFQVNVAGALVDLNESGTIKSRRFNQRPAGIDTGLLRSSITSELVGDDAVAAGSNVEPQASLINFGGLSDPIPVTSAAKKGLAKVLSGPRGGDSGNKQKRAALQKRSKALSDRSKEITQRLQSGSITQAEAKELRAQLKTERQQIAEERESLKAEKKKAAPGLASQIGFLFQIDSLTTTVAQRQFLPTEGDLGDLEKDIAELVVLKIEGKL